MKAIETDSFENINKDPLILLTGTRESSLTKRRKDASDVNPGRATLPAFGSENVHALEGLACRKRVAPASSHAAPASRARRSRRLRSTLAAAPCLLAHALVTKQ